MTSFGSRAPISLAICSRARSMAASASQPNGWLRLPGCPNFSVKYGIITSSTRGSTGVVELLSMKIGNFSAMVAVSSVLRSGERRWHPDRLAAHLLEAHGVEELFDRGLDRPHGLPDIALLELRAPQGLVTLYNPQRALDGPED